MMSRPPKPRRRSRPGTCVVMVSSAIFAVSSSMASRAWADPDASAEPTPPPAPVADIAAPPPGLSEPAASFAAGPALDTGRHPPTSAYVAASVAAAAVVVGTIFGVRALREKRRFDGGDNTTARAEAVEKNAVFADMAFGAALAFGATAAVLWFGRPDGPTAEGTGAAPRPPIVWFPVLLPSAPGAAALVRF